MKKLLYSVTAALLMLTTLRCSKDASSSVSGDISAQVGSTSRFAISGNHLFTVDQQSLNVFDITVPSSPSHMNKAFIGTDIETIFPYRDNLFIGAQSAMYVYNITQPTQPVKKAEVSHVITSCDPVVADDRYAFVTLRASGPCSRGQTSLDIIDVKNLENARILTSYSTFTSPKGLAIDNSHLFICDGGIRVFDRRDVYNLKQLSFEKSCDPNDLLLHNGFVIATAADGIYQYRFENGNLALISKIPVVQ